MNPVDKQLDAFNKKDLAVFLDCYSDDVQAFMLESNQLISQGKDQLKKSMQESFNAKPEAKTSVLSRINQNNLVIDLEKIIGYVEGKVVTSIAIYEVINSKIAKIWFGGRLIE
ncbi:MAG: nuclear transport factor 2 family protein [Candidatus Hodarchaeales archaeon]|jgi:hypothetical protein